MDIFDKFIVAKCESKWELKCCKRGCMFIFPDDEEIKKAMRIAMKILIQKCPKKKAKFVS